MGDAPEFILRYTPQKEQKTSSLTQPDRLPFLFIDAHTCRDGGIQTAVMRRNLYIQYFPQGATLQSTISFDIKMPSLQNICCNTMYEKEYALPSKKEFLQSQHLQISECSEYCTESHKVLSCIMIIRKYHQYQIKAILYVRHGGSLVDSSPFVRRVMGSNPALAAMQGPWASSSFAIPCALPRETPTQYPCCVGSASE